MRKTIATLCLCVLAASVLASDYYRVNVKRTTNNLYEVIGQNISIVTRYCYHYTYGEEAIVRIDSQAGFTIGEIVFDDGTKCDIAELI